MNQERIIELYATVWLEVTKGVHPDDWYNTEIEHKIAVKFAELIIKECGVALSPMLRDMVSRGKAYELIKEHFGVEE